MVKTKPEPEAESDAGAPLDIGEFRLLSETMLNKLIEQGRRAAEELDKAIRSQFELSDADTLRVR
ncbi:MAG TPA: hypothetical protein VHU40_15215 [Polyangia bacterium]|jgi:hypothetical protein|nr:hypothetical protein [Polyangia bacterium]